MRIDRVKDFPGFSLINEGETRVQKLPKGLKNLFIKMLESLCPEIVAIIITGNDMSPDIEFESISGFEMLVWKFPTSQMIEIAYIARLYRFYKSQLKRAVFQNFWRHSFTHCSICHKNYRVDKHQRCPNPKCKSQEYWQEIDGQ
jgi:hypothetical protein